MSLEIKLSKASIVLAPEGKECVVRVFKANANVPPMKFTASSMELSALSTFFAGVVPKPALQIQQPVKPIGQPTIGQPGSLEKKDA